MMKKQIIPLLVILPALLAGCSETQWSWWETENLSIERAIPVEDAKNAMDSSAANAKVIKTIKQSYTHETYYKNYLGKYTTEDDSNISESQTLITDVYDNYVLTSDYSKSIDKSYLHASSSQKEKRVYYKFANKENDVIYQRQSVDSGYSKVEVSELDQIPYTNPESFQKEYVIGPNWSSSIITSASSATYGFAKNNEIIVEIMKTENNEEYTIKFNNNKWPKVKNIYTMYRLCPIKTDAEGKSEYVIDYYKQSIQVLIGKNIFGEDLKEPFLLEKIETVQAFYRNSNGNYDISSIPAVTTK